MIQPFAVAGVRGRTPDQVIFAQLNTTDAELTPVFSMPIAATFFTLASDAALWHSSDAHLTRGSGCESEQRHAPTERCRPPCHANANAITR